MTTKQTVAKIQSDLKEKLRKNGLDPEVWGAYFASEGFINCRQLKHAGDDDKKNIKGHSTRQWEKNAVEACFVSEVHENKEAKLETQLTTTVASLRDSMTKLSDVLGENERRQRTSISFNEALGHKELHTNLTKWDVSGSVLTSRGDPLSSLKLVTEISEGRILRGCYHHADMRHCVMPRRKLINIQQDSVNLMLTTTPEIYESFEFFDQTHSQAFDHVIKNWGLKAAVGARYGFGAFSFNINFKGNTSMTDSTNYMSRFTAFTSIRDVLTISTASFSLADVKHYISDDAIAALQKIENNPDKKESACLSFFEEFGSHYFTGTYTFGGRFSRSVSCHSNDKMNKSDSLKLVKDARPVSMSGMFKEWAFSSEGGDVNIKDGQYGDLKKEEDFYVTKTHDMTGGPPEVDQLSLWRKGLVESNKTWAIIDKNCFTAKWRSVWDLLTDDHSKEFKDINSLRNALKSAWKPIGSTVNTNETKVTRFRLIYDL